MNPTETRSSHPSSAQVETLVEFMERNPGMAQGFLRTQTARERSRRKWEELAVRLNSIGGTIKTYKQWTKYWSDKKSAVRKKVAALSAARRRTDGGLEDEVELSEMEERIVALCGGGSLSTGDARSGIQPLPPSPNEPRPEGVSQDLHQDVSSPDPQLMNTDDVTESEPVSPASESVLQDEDSLPPETEVENEIKLFCPKCKSEVCLTSEGMQMVQRSPSKTNMVKEEPPSPEPMFEARSPPALHTSDVPPAASSARKRHWTAPRRRLIQRTPPSQLAKLTDRFMSLEEKRLENERLATQNQKKMLDIFQAMSEAWTRQAQAMQDLCESIRRGT